jgi:hypothetical protein
MSQAVNFGVRPVKILGGTGVAGRDGGNSIIAKSGVEKPRGRRGGKRRFGVGHSRIVHNIKIEIAVLIEIHPASYRTDCGRTHGW